MKFFIFLFFLFLMLPLSLAITLSGSPSSLNFNLGIGDEECQIFTVFSDDYSGDLTSLMKWAGKDVEVTNPNQFNLTSEDISLNINYLPEEIENFNGQEEIKVCISGNEIGKWKGSLEYRTITERNIGVGVGVWLRVNISEKELIVEDSPVPSSGGGWGGGSSGGGSYSQIQNNTNNSTNLSSINMTNTTETAQKTQDKQEENVLIDREVDSAGELEGAGITGAVVGTNGKKIGGLIIIAVILAAGIGLAIYNKNKIKKQKLAGLR